MNPRLQAVLVAATLVILMGLGVFAAIRFEPFPAATSYWLGMLSVGWPHFRCRQNHPWPRSPHPSKDHSGSGPATKNMVRDGFCCFS